MVPVLMHTPPIMSRRSTTAAFLPSFAAAMAAFCPPGPDPSTRTSKSYMAVSVPQGPAKVSGSDRLVTELVRQRHPEFVPAGQAELAVDAGQVELDRAAGE